MHPLYFPYISVGNVSFSSKVNPSQEMEKNDSSSFRMGQTGY
jgi:hypothetical protein